MKVKGHTLNDGARLDVDKYVNAYISNIGDEQYQQVVKSVLLEELNLHSNSRFKAFVADVAINTMDVAGSPADARGSESLRLPALDKFINLFLSLRDPRFTSRNQYARNQMEMEMKMAFNAESGAQS